MSEKMSESQQNFLAQQRARLNEARSTLVNFRITYGHEREFSAITEQIRIYLRDLNLEA